MDQRTKSITLPLVILIAVSGCMGSSSRGEEATPTPIPTPIVPATPTYEVRRGEVIKMLEFTGRIAPVMEEELFFRTSGYVEAIYVDRDELVQAGDILAELEVTGLKHQLAQAEADVIIAEHELENAQNPYDEMDLAGAQRAVTQAEVALENAKKNLIVVQNDSDNAQRIRDLEYEVNWYEVNYGESLRKYEQGQITKERLDLDYNNLMTAKERLETALIEREIDLANAQEQVAQAEYNLQKAQDTLAEILAGPDPDEVEVAQSRVKSAQATLAYAQDALEAATLVAPFDGTVLSLSLTEGRAVEAYNPVLVVGDFSELEVSAALLGSEMNELEEGMPVTCIIADRPGVEIKGYIRRLPYPYGGGGRVSDVEAEDESTRVALETSASAHGLEVGDLVRVTVVLERKADVLWLPPQAIRTFEGRKFVVVQEGEAQRRVDIKLGIESEDRVEIEEGLTEGQIVIGQ